MNFPSLFNPDGSLDREMLEIGARQVHQESEARDMEQALALSAAGWTAETGPQHVPHPFTGNVAVMSWYWRRPSRRPGRKGRLYLSTNQAHNALLRQK